jgi:hypothetical protein
MKITIGCDLQYSALLLYFQYVFTEIVINSSLSATTYSRVLHGKNVYSLAAGTYKKTHFTDVAECKGQTYRFSSEIGPIRDLLTVLS